MLTTNQNDEYGAPCVDGENVFLFLTDGEPTLGSTTSTGLIDLIKSYNKSIKFFSYALGQDPNL